MPGAAALLSLLLVPRAFASGSQPAFYYWRTQWSPSPALLEGLAKNGIGRLYTRFFDVDWDAQARAARPVAPIEFKAPMPADVEVVPVVYLANAVFLRIGAGDAEKLADQVWRKTARMSKEQGVRFKELQVDCDWSDKSRARFFAFAALLRKRAALEGVALSATIRLHQVKYFGRTGVPPVDRGMLMFYNMGRLEAMSARASIFNPEDAGKYASSIAAYPLPFDIALPIFSWIVHSREGRVISLIANVDAAELEAAGGFTRSGPLVHRARSSFFFRGRHFREGDSLRIERMDPARTQEAAALAARGAGPKTFGAVAFFDLDERRIKHYAPADFTAILKHFK